MSTKLQPALSPDAQARAAAALRLVQESGAVDPAAEVVNLCQLAGGWSRHTFVLTVSAPESGGLREFVVRADAPGATLESDLALEHATYVLLADQPVLAARPYGAELTGDNPFGGAFFIVDRLPGHAPNVWKPRDQADLESDWNGPRGIAEDLVAQLAAIHAVPEASLGAHGRAKPFEELVGHWRDVQRHAQLVRDPVVDAAYAWLAERAPAPVADRLVHGDYRIGNTLIDGGRITGILDWELSFRGDPRFDLGYLSLAYYAGRLFDTRSPLVNAVAERDWLHRRYEELTGAAVDPEAVRSYSALGALMVIAIMTTGIRRYVDGESHDVRTVWGRFAIASLRRELTEIMDW